MFSAAVFLQQIFCRMQNVECRISFIAVFCLLNLQISSSVLCRIFLHNLDISASVLCRLFKLECNMFSAADFLQNAECGVHNFLYSSFLSAESGYFCSSFMQIISSWMLQVFMQIFVLFWAVFCILLGRFQLLDYAAFLHNL